jgi:hypothetical protein
MSSAERRFSMRRVGVIGLFGLLACATLVSGEREASACGGCFHEAPTPQNPITESSVVSDHRMVFALAPQQTVLWDQIRYTGNPSEFAWVLPVRPGTTIELSHDEWIASLDATTQPKIIQPRPPPSSFGGGAGGSDYEGSGCACGSTTAMSDFAARSAGDGTAQEGGVLAPPEVQVISQQVVGPYETVIVRSEKPKALETWLRDHGYAVPDSLLPIIAAYTAEKLDFVALRLRPGQGVRAMRPVRIVSPGADPTLPLRMVAAGIGAKVGLTLYVLSEGRYRPQNFPEGQIDESKLVWDTQQSRSNYQELSAAVMAGGGDRTWLTEFAGKPITQGTIPRVGSTTLFDAYYGSCQNLSRPAPGQPIADAGTSDANAPDASGGDAGDLDASILDASILDAGDSGVSASDDGGTTGTGDAGAGRPSVPSSLCRRGNELCCEFDDLEVAVGAMHRGDVWLTRLRADLPASALAQDLRLEAHPEQLAVSNIHDALLPAITGTTARIAPARSTHLGTGLVLLGTAFLVGRMVRRGRRRDLDGRP